jgi:sulfoxide reductase heme-binding subunit YedZ
MDLLWFLLFLPILAKVFSLPIAKTLVRYRKELGILMGMLAMVHSMLYLTDTYTTILPWDIQFWIDNGSISYLGIGMVATFFTFLLLITSNIASMKLLGKKWKLLHRTAYIIILLTVLHVILLK